MNEVVRKETSMLMVLVTTFGVVFMVFVAKMLYDMTSYVGKVAGSVDDMSNELVVISKKINEMNEGVIAMKNGVVTMNTYMERDIKSMSSSVESMSSSVGEMKTEMNKGVDQLTPLGMVKSFIP